MSKIRKENYRMKLKTLNKKVETHTWLDLSNYSLHTEGAYWSELDCNSGNSSVVLILSCILGLKY